MKTPEDLPSRLELWGGLECTVARLGDGYRNQLMETGHYQREADLDAIAALGIRTLRYPVLWETVAPEDPQQCDWRWHDKRLAKLRALGIAPIAGLLHHGSGPRYTSLLDPELPQMLARHAEQVAMRYPWISMYTPVNEPLTTARFSGLYGHWYPHARDVASFLRILVNQCRAVVLSMQAIRRITPHARLVQTEDLGKVFSTPKLSYQADYENERRWLCFDLLCGRVDSSHRWYKAFLKCGINAAELAFFVKAQCVPDIIGINHYLTSERYLDQRLDLFPHYHHAGNRRHRYADVEARRVELPSETTGPLPRLQEAWQRYRLPMVVTEAHHGGTRDEQLRWLMEVWNAARELRAQGADLRAVTMWSLLGCMDWNTLLVERNGFYESGAFDARSDPPRPTALATAAKVLATSGDFDHPALDVGGRWRRGEGYYQPPQSQARPDNIVNSRRLLIAGAGTLGQAFSRICESRGLNCMLLPRAAMDITDATAVHAALQHYRPWAVINTAGYARVYEAERNAERCFQENTLGAEVLALACARANIPYVTFSSDLVFDGRLGRAYVESDAINPLGIYGASKAEAEKRVAEAWPQALVIRTSAFFSPWDSYNFVYAVLHALDAGQRFEASDGVVVSPTYVPDLVHGALDLLIDGAVGVWHLTNQGLLSWYDLAARAAAEAGVATAGLVRGSEGISSVTALSSERGLILPPLDSAIGRFVRERAFT
jgi:dTDP-4-dehydrorhamnose reductase